jgi:hypothetical protein
MKAWKNQILRTKNKLSTKIPSMCAHAHAHKFVLYGKQALD